jgi:chorismate dehydratase
VNQYSALRGLRVGCVQYLNSKPLIAPYDGPVVFDHPSRLADMLAAGEIDMALVPAFEALRAPTLPIADGIAIASRGEVYSVVMAHACPIEAVRTVSMDPASRTSNNLCRCLLAEFYGISPAFEASSAPAAADRAQVLIGNQAIHFRQAPAGQGMQYLDMGSEWLARTGLPFVYAVWQLRREIPNPAEVASALRAVKNAGLACIHQIAQHQTDFPPAFAEHYLTDIIKFDLGPEEKAGLAAFRDLLIKHSLIRPGPAVTFV